MANWYVSMAGTEQGPFTDRQLKQLAAEGRLTRTDLVRREDQQTGCEAQRLKGLFETPPPLQQSALGTPPVSQPSGLQMAPGLAPPNFVSPSGPQIEIRKTPLNKPSGVGTKVAIGCAAGVLALFVLCAGLAQLGRSIQRQNRNEGKGNEIRADNEAAENERGDELHQEAIAAMAQVALAVDKNRRNRTPEEFISLMRMAASEMKATELSEYRYLLTIEPSNRDVQRAPEITIMTLRFGKADPKATLVQFRQTDDGYVLMGAAIGDKRWIVHKETGALVDFGQRR